MSTSQRRVRLELSHPAFPPSKILFDIPIEVRNAESLKGLLCQQLPELKDAAISPDQLILEIDGFEIRGGTVIDYDKDIITYAFAT